VLSCEPHRAAPRSAASPRTCSSDIPISSQGARIGSDRRCRLQRLLGPAHSPSPSPRPPAGLLLSFNSLANALSLRPGGEFPIAKRGAELDVASDGAPRVQLRKPTEGHLCARHTLAREAGRNRRLPARRCRLLSPSHSRLLPARPLSLLPEASTLGAPRKATGKQLTWSC
jgi:hypothetical protein